MYRSVPGAHLSHGQSRQWVKAATKARSSNEAEILHPAALDKGAEEVAVLPGSLLPAFIHLAGPAGKSRAASGFLNSKLPNGPVLI